MHYLNRQQGLKKAKKVIEVWKQLNMLGNVDEKEILSRLVQTRKSCSCYQCMNPRRSPYFSGDEKLTIQERKALDDQRDQIADVAQW